MSLFSTHPAIDQQVVRLLPISDLLRDPRVTDISIDHGEVRIDRGADGIENTDIIIPDVHARAVIRLLAAANGQHLDPETSFITLSLACGARFHGALPPAANEAQITIRTHRKGLRSFADFHMSQEHIGLIVGVVEARKTIVIGGRTNSGKSTFQNICLSLIPANQKLIVIEDNAQELQVRSENVMRRLAMGRADFKRHVFEALRCRPDWLCLGEVRDHSAWDMLDASRTGHAGITTVHASSAEGIVTRLMSLANCDREFVREAVDLVVYITRMPDGRRAISQIKEIEK
jgi:pilus assembly protein CpaF